MSFETFLNEKAAERASTEDSYRLRPPRQVKSEVVDEGGGGGGFRGGGVFEKEVPCAGREDFFLKKYFSFI